MSKKSALPDKSDNHLAVFQEKTIRRAWHNEEWWFSVVDVCGVLADSADAGAYWRKLKQRLNAEGSEPVTFCHGLKLEAPDGKQRVTDCANTKITSRLQSINSDCPLEQNSSFPRSGSITKFCPLRGLFILLDSRLRGNDGANGLFGIKALQKINVRLELQPFFPS